ncbi:hydrolase [Micromonospora sp. ATCC 39149]|uniref:Alpha/beta fold hydrolase n=1 Tax=Micromonospora carbonacea TaxID=47853 RepID=A0A7D6CBA1_9ACTN|nr:alpha/beta hydrolase [Micromonospora sp. ATCC 39149]EEP70441.1 hydrolase [Micromonospora sp. ATCC 39149]QLJ96845.1 alpha/beta fold hydrolase [Micromonospora carbonacea]
MNRPRRRTLLVAVLATTAGLVAVPAAYAGTTRDAGLARYHHQHVNWKSCQRGADDTDGRALDEAGVQCADIRVPLDYRRPRGRTITVAIARSKATDTAHYAGPLIFNLGGPANPVLSTVPLAREGLGAAGAKFDIIGMDIRFSGRSTPIDCGWPVSWLPRSAGAGRESFNRMVTLSKDLARRCARTNADVLPYASTANAARDMDVIRAALGAPKLSFLGYSQGSYLGAQYMQRFGQRAGRMVLDSAIDPDRPGVTSFPDRTVAVRREAALREWAALVAAHEDQLNLGTTTGQVLGTVDRVYRAAARTPLRVGQYLVDDTVIPGLIVDLLVDDSEEGALELAATVQVLVQAADTGNAEPTETLATALAGQLTGRDSAQRSAATAIQCGDAPVSRNVQAYWRDIQAVRTEAPLFGPLGSNITPCAFWPNPPRERPIRIRNGVPALVVQAAGDVSAILEMGQAMHRALNGSRMITLAGARGHGVYLFRGSGCVDAAVNAYLDTGNLPAADLTCLQ